MRCGQERRTPRESARIDTIFSLSSILVPFALGTAIGAIATDRVPVGNAAGDLWSSWLNPTSIFIGVLAVATSAYLAAVYLAADAARDGEQALERQFRLRALGSGVVAGALAIAGIVIVDRENHDLFHSLLSGRALPAVIVSGLAGIATLVLVHRRRYEPARYGAAVAVAAIIAGWALSRWPTILPGLTVDQAAAGHDTLVCLIVAVLVGARDPLPRARTALPPRRSPAASEPRESTARRAQRRRGVPATSIRSTRAARGRLPDRAASDCSTSPTRPGRTPSVSSCLIGFVALAFGAIVVPALDQQAATR